MPQSPPATIVHGDYRLGNTMFGPAAPARLMAIFDWEMATIGDPLADVGYMMMHWTEPGDRRREVQPPRGHRAARVSRRATSWSRVYEQRSGRSMQALNWYVDARAVEGGRVHGGQLQARPRRARPTTRT